MAVLPALRRTPGALRRNPVVFVPIVALLAVQSVYLVLQAVNPLVAAVVSTGISLGFVLFLPLFQGGIVAMADEALDGRTSLSTFREAGVANYVSLLIVYLGLAAINLVIVIAVFVVAVVGVFTALGDGSGGTNLAALAVVVGLAGLLGLAYLLLTFFVQFYGQAIVLDGFGAVDAVKRSVGVVRDNLLATLGYTLLVGALGGLAGAVFGGASLLVSPGSQDLAVLPDLSLAGVVGVSLAVVLLGSVFSGFLGVYAVAFYREIRPDVDGP